MAAVESLAALPLIWLLWELAAFFVSHPVHDGEPIRPPLSVGDYLWYNPGVLVDGR
jgi:hypothetical protein